jgi:hypothetical protein
MLCCLSHDSVFDLFLRQALTVREVYDVPDHIPSLIILATLALLDNSFLNPQRHAQGSGVKFYGRFLVNIVVFCKPILKIS